MFDFENEFTKSEAGNVPFPYLVIDEILSEATLNEIERNWPEKDLFNVEGHNQHDLRLRLAEYQYTDEDQLLYCDNSYLQENVQSEFADFWRGFINGTLMDLGAALLKYYAPYLEKMWPSFTPEFFPNLVWLEDAPAKYGEHGLRVHTHYDHDPFWAVTCLIYLNDGSGIIPGTNLQKLPDGMARQDYVDASLNSRRWFEDARFSVQKDFQFKRNRLLSFVDGPLSFHGVLPFTTDENVDTTRKMVLTHFALHPKHIKKNFGCSKNDFRNAVMTHQATEEISAAVGRDIDNYQQAVRMEETGSTAEYQQRISLKGFNF